MKTSKLLKLFTLPAVAGVISIAPLTLCQCGSSGKPVDPGDPVVPSSSDVNITTTTDKDGNKVSTLTTKYSVDKITDISVTIGSKTLTKDTDYKVEGLATNSSTVKVTIFKATLDKYSGTITITPTIESPEEEISSITVSPTSKTVKKGDKLYASQITVTAHYSSGKTSSLSYSTGYKIYDGSIEITNFSTTGYIFNSTGTTVLTIKAVKDTSKTAKITFTVTDTITVRFVAVNGEVNRSTYSAERGSTWGDIKNYIAANAGYGYKQDSLVWKKNNESGEDISDSTTLTDGMTICAYFKTMKDIEHTETVSHTYYAGDQWDGPAYIPQDNVSGESSVKLVSYKTNSEYTFEVDTSTIQGIRYFWIYHPGGLYKFKNRNFVEAKHIIDSKETILDCKYESYNNGEYIYWGDSLSKAQSFSTGKLSIKIKFFEANSFLPVYQK